MRTLLNRWNTIWLRPLTDEEALIILDSYNKTRYSRRKKQEGLLEQASREAHERQEVYFATILNDDGSPYCAMESNVGYFGLDFLGNKYEDYLLYEYREDEPSGTLFLKLITLFECYPGTTEKKIRIDFRYTKQGDYSSLLYQGESYDGTYEQIRTDYPPISAEELEKLWVDYPKFGEYDQLIRLDRIPQLARDRILEYTDKEFPAFREHLQRDIDRYEHPTE